MIQCALLSTPNNATVIDHNFAILQKKVVEGFNTKIFAKQEF